MCGVGYPCIWEISISSLHLMTRTSSGRKPSAGCDWLDLAIRLRRFHLYSVQMSATHLSHEDCLYGQARHVSNGFSGLVQTKYVRQFDFFRRIFALSSLV